MGRDRRVFHRVQVAIPCRMNSHLFGLESQATSVNLSLGGMSLVAPVTWPEGSQVQIQLEETGFKLDGVICFRVASDKQFRYGVKFHRMSVGELVKLRQVLREKYNGPLAVR